MLYALMLVLAQVSEPPVPLRGDPNPAGFLGKSERAVAGRLVADPIGFLRALERELSPEALEEVEGVLLEVAGLEKGEDPRKARLVKEVKEVFGDKAAADLKVRPVKPPNAGGVKR